VCARTWGIPAELAAIEFVDADDSTSGSAPFGGLRVVRAPRSEPPTATANRAGGFWSAAANGLAPAPWAQLAAQLAAQLELARFCGGASPAALGVPGARGSGSRAFAAAEPGREDVAVAGWARTRAFQRKGDVDRALELARYGFVPVLWTPSVKALWAPLVPLPPAAAKDGTPPLPLHQLRLSAGRLRVHWCSQRGGEAGLEALGVPLPLGLSVDRVRIEIGRESAEGL
jgi:hypothetical protein